MYGIGVEHFGYEEFKEGKFFNGKLFVDEGKTIYKALGYPSKSLSNLWKLFQEGSRRRYKQASNAGVQGNLRGDGLQLGGTVIVAPSGEVIYHKPQEFYGDDPQNEELVKVLDNYFQKVQDKKD